jgi:hypothetical protein
MKRVEHYSDIESFEKGLREEGCPEERVKEVLEHERKHYEKAIELGYRPTYELIVRKRRLSNKVNLQPRINIDLTFPAYNSLNILEDMEKIFGSPESLSPGDEESLKLMAFGRKNPIKTLKKLARLAKRQ